MDYFCSIWYKLVMKINLSKKDLQTLIKLLHTREINIDVSSMYLYYLTNETYSIKEKNILSLMNKRKLSVNQAFYYEFINVLDLDYKDEDYILANKTCKISDIKALDIEKYISNPYYQTIKVPEVKEETWYFKYDRIEAYEGFMYNDISVLENEYFAEKSSFGFFQKPYKYLSVSEGDDIWMCVTPHEMETMEPSINEARGNVLVFGLGLGYYPFMISRKSNVNSITIIEKDIRVISLFKKYILPQFPNKEKITIIEEDAFSYLKKNDIENKFNYSFVDLWHNVDDGIPLYLRFKKETKEMIRTHFSYWIETSLLVYLRRLMLSLLDEQADNASEDNYLKEENYDDHIINRMYQITKNKTINSIEEIYSLLSDNGLRKIAEEI